MERSGSLKTSFIVLVIGLVGAVIFIQLFVMGSQPAKDFIQSCQIGQCYKDTPRCTPDQPISQGTCKAEINDETRSGTCYSSWDAPDNCLISPNAETDSSDDQPDETNKPEEQPEEQDEENDGEVSSDDVFIEIRRGDRQGEAGEVLHQTTEEISQETSFTVWSKGAEDVTCEVQLFGPMDTQPGITAPYLFQSGEDPVTFDCSNPENIDYVADEANSGTVTVRPSNYLSSGGRGADSYNETFNMEVIARQDDQLLASAIIPIDISYEQQEQT